MQITIHLDKLVALLNYLIYLVTAFSIVSMSSKIKCTRKIHDEFGCYYNLGNIADKLMS